MKRKSIEELRGFCEGYATAKFFYSGPSLIGDWVAWGGYDINISGDRLLSEDLEIKSKKTLRVNAYKAKWKNINNPTHSFTLKAR